LRLLVQAGVVDDAKAKYPIESFDEVRAMTWRLLNPSPGASSLQDCSGSIPRAGDGVSRRPQGASNSKLKTKN
jgi:hypothetical protein